MAARVKGKGQPLSYTQLGKLVGVDLSPLEEDIGEIAEYASEYEDMGYSEEDAWEMGREKYWENTEDQVNNRQYTAASKRLHAILETAFRFVEKDGKFYIVKIK